MTGEVDTKIYSEKIEQEARYWGEFEEESLKYGIPWWVDLRRAEKIVKPQEKVWFYDPKIESLLRGKEKDYMIARASRNKGRALDLGCGAGWLSLELARNGVFVDGVDVSARRIEIGRQFLEENPFVEDFGGVNYEVADLNCVELKPATYDSVVVWDSLHHVQNLDRLLVEVEQSLKPEGDLLVYDHLGRQPNAVERACRLSKRFLKKLAPRQSERLENARLPAVAGGIGSPFEDVAGLATIELIARYFDVKVLKLRLSPLIMLATEKVESYGFLALLASIDRIVCNLHLLNGEYVFIHARKREFV